MRCLYCAKQLPLLKRLTKGEFCSAAHRQQYQLEYSQPRAEPSAAGRSLRKIRSKHDEQPPRANPVKETNGSRYASVSKPAANGKSAAESRGRARRLLLENRDKTGATSSRAFAASARNIRKHRLLYFRASVARNGTLKPANAADTSVAVADAPSPTLSISALAKSVEQALPETARAHVAEPAPTAMTEPVPVVEATHAEQAPVEPTPVAPTLVTEPEVVAPAALAGPIKLCPPAPSAKCASPARLETEIQFATAPEIPRPGIAPPIVQLEAASRVSYLAVAGPATSPWRSRAGRVEIRDFARVTPSLQLVTAAASPRMEAAAAQPAKLAFAPSPSRSAAILRAEPQQAFRSGQIEVGEIAVLDLPTTGFENSETYAAEAAPVKTSPKTPVKTPAESPQNTVVSPAPIHAELLRRENFVAGPAAADAIAIPAAEETVTPVSKSRPLSAESAGGRGRLRRSETIATRRLAEEIASGGNSEARAQRPRSRRFNPVLALRSLATRVAELETKVRQAESVATVPVEAPSVVSSPEPIG